MIAWDDVFTIDLDGYRSALEAGDVGGALIIQHSRFAKIAVAVLAEEGYWLDARKAKLTNGQYIQAAALAHKAHMDAYVALGRHPSPDALLASRLLEAVAAFFRMFESGRTEADFDLAAFGLVCGMIGHEASTLMSARAGVYESATLLEITRDKQRGGQRKATEQRIAWQGPALEFAREQVTRDDTVSNRSLGRMIRLRFKTSHDNLPEVERIVEVVAAWRRGGELPPRRKK